MIDSIPFQETVSMVARNCNLIQALDPLGVDDFMLVLHEFTAQHRLDEILIKLGEITAGFDETIYASVPRSYAALRDLDFLITSADYLETGCFHRVPSLERALRNLGKAANHIPRGCYFTYAHFNPLNQRMRTFTGLPEERLFIEQLHHGTTRLDDSFPILPELVDAAIDSPEFERMVLRLCEHFDYMTKSMVKVMRAIPPHIFSGRITPFFRPVEIGGVTYPGITGAHVQLLGIDLVIYGNDTNDSVYQAYVAENLPMLLPHHKQFLKQALDKLQGESFMTRIRERLLPGDRQYDLRQASASLGALGCYLLRVLSFRHPHLKAAKDNLPLRREERGSGGYSVSTLELLIGHTRNAAETLKVWSEQFAGAPITSGFGCTHPN